MAMSNQIRVKVVRYRNPEVDPFKGWGIRELSRAIGWDFSYLSKVKSGKVAITEKKFYELCDLAANAVMWGSTEIKER